jgi:hypothetical protein
MPFTSAMVSSCANSKVVATAAAQAQVTGSVDKMAHRKSNRDLQAQRIGDDSEHRSVDNPNMLLAIDHEKALNLSRDKSAISHPMGFAQNFRTSNEVSTGKFIQPSPLTQIMELDGVEDGIDMSSYGFDYADISFTDISENRRGLIDDFGDYLLLVRDADDLSGNGDTLYELSHGSHICPSPQASELHVRQRDSKPPGVRNMSEEEVLTSPYVQPDPDYKYNNTPERTHALFWNSPSECSNQLSRLSLPRWTIARPVPSLAQPEEPARGQLAGTSPELRFWRQNKLY